MKTHTHTPTPWKVTGKFREWAITPVGGHSASGYTMSALAKIVQSWTEYKSDLRGEEGTKYSSGQSDNEMLANAAFIVQAANTYDTLMTALEQIAQIQRDKCEHANAEILYVLLDNKVGIAEAAIAKARP